eukprot:7888153-Pyramimonas_sp.AAC.1
MPHDERKALGAHLVDRHAEQLALAQGNPEGTFALANKIAEDFLDIRCDSHVKRGARGRGEPPRFVQGWAAAPVSPQHGAMSRT